MNTAHRHCFYQIFRIFWEASKNYGETTNTNVSISRESCYCCSVNRQCLVFGMFVFSFIVIVCGLIRKIFSIPMLHEYEVFKQKRMSLSLYGSIIAFLGAAYFIVCTHLIGSCALTSITLWYVCVAANWLCFLLIILIHLLCACIRIRHINES